MKGPDGKDWSPTPSSCIDCHDPQTMQLRVTRPGVPDRHRRSWPRATTRCRTCRASSGGGRASRKAGTTPTPRRPAQEMRSLVCGQCHVEYYFQKDTQAGHLPVAQGAEGRRHRAAITTRSKFADWTHAGRRHADAEGPAPGVRDVEPGHPRPQRRDLRRLPHAVRPRGGGEGQRPPRPQPDAQRQPGVPDVPPLPGDGDHGPRGRHPGPHPRAARPGRGRAAWT